MAKIFLFDELGERIGFYPTPEDCAKAIGVDAKAVRSAVFRGSVLLARYYVGHEPRFKDELILGEKSHNAALSITSGNKANVGEVHLGRRVSVDELCGLELLSSGLCFDEYIFGSTPLRAEQPESIPAWKHKFWKERDSNFNY